jgi:phage-related protein
MLQTTASNIASPLTITLTATGPIDTVTVRNMTDGTFFSLDIQAVEGDVIIIDTKTYKATKNGQNILASRVTGSRWQYAHGTVYLSIFDRDGGLYASDMDIKVQYREAIL